MTYTVVNVPSVSMATVITELIACWGCEILPRESEIVIWLWLELTIYLMRHQGWRSTSCVSSPFQ